MTATIGTAGPKEIQDLYRTMSDLVIKDNHREQLNSITPNRLCSVLDIDQICEFKFQDLLVKIVYSANKGEKLPDILIERMQNIHHAATVNFSVAYQQLKLEKEAKLVKQNSITSPKVFIPNGEELTTALSNLTTNTTPHLQPITPEESSPEDKAWKKKSEAIRNAHYGEQVNDDPSASPREKDAH